MKKKNLQLIKPKLEKVINAIMGRIGISDRDKVINATYSGQTALDYV